MPKHDAPAYADASCGTAMLTQSTDGRTDGLTQKHLTLGLIASTFVTRAQAYEDPSDLEAIQPFGAILSEVLPDVFRERKRWPRLRSGERKWIHRDVRRLVIERDAGACRLCGSWFWGVELDHVVPWSAFGPDTSDNLRVLCPQCNDERSNYATPWDRPQIPVTSCCFWCYLAACQIETVDEYEEWMGVQVATAEGIKAYCGECGTTSWVPTTTWLAGGTK